ncbi:MAG: xanthine dehydrogenase molybdopterin binding subunit, partial [Pseudomonadota bacterium]
MSQSVHNSVAHDSAALHVSGAARYIDDLPEPPGTLHLFIAQSPHAHATLNALHLDAVRRAPGVVAVLSAHDIPGVNDCSPVMGDDPVFVERTALYAGQSVFAVAAESLAEARAAAALHEADWTVHEAITTVDAAMAAERYVLEPRTLERGAVDTALATAPHRLEGELRIGGQDHFYLEGQVCLTLPGEAGTVHVHSSTQHPSEVQHTVAKVLGLSDHDVVCEVRRMGGGFGGKESQPALFASIAALATWVTGRAAKVCLDRDDDMRMTGKRHDFRVRYHVGFDNDGVLRALDVEHAVRCGMSADLSGAIADRALFHTDNCYFIPAVRVRSYRCFTHTVSNTAFRGFGGPQGMLGIEQIIAAVAADRGLDPLAVRQRNFYRAGALETPYGMVVEDFVADRIVDELAERANYRARHAEINAFNAESTGVKRGIALTPVKFGISFTTTHLNQAGALLQLYSDGSVLLNHGGTEMGQGLYIKVAQVVADVFGIPLDRVRVSSTRTDKVPNTSATAASSGSDLNGMAAQNAAHTVRARLADVAADRFGCAAADIEFADGAVRAGEHQLPFDELVKAAYLARVSLSATGFYATPKIHYDPASLTGRPFYYFAYGAAVSEVSIDTLTGEYRVDRVDILHDAGTSLNPAIDLGQVEGGFIQGMGWLTTEELWWTDDGELKTHAPSTYKIPTAGD